MTKGGRVENLKPFNQLPVEKQREIRSAGGKASKRKQAERKTLVETLKAVLYAKSDIDPNKVVLDEVIENIVVKMLSNPDSKDLKVLAEVLGELTTKAEISADVKAKLFDL